MNVITNKDTISDETLAKKSTHGHLSSFILSPVSSDHGSINSASDLNPAVKALLVKNLMRLYNDTKNVASLTDIPEPPRSPSYKAFKKHQKIIYVSLEQPGSSKLGLLIFVLVIFGIFTSFGQAVFQDSKSLLSSSIPFTIVNICILIIFVIEFSLRIFSANAFSNKSILTVVKKAYLTDLIAIAPLVVQIFINQNTLTSIHMDFNLIRLFKMLTILKLLNYTHSFSILKQGFHQSMASLTFLIFMIFISNVVFSMMIYYAEALNPKSRISQGIPTAFWWSIVTMTTVGYGDVAPITPLGKVIGSFVSIYGTIVVALPVVILGYHFQEVYNQMEEERLIERLKGKEFKGRDTMNRDHKENFFLDKRIENIELYNEKIMKLLVNSGTVYKEVSSDLKSLYRSIYRGTRDDTENDQHSISQKIKTIEETGRFKHKISVKRLFKRGFGRGQTNILKQASLGVADRGKGKSYLPARQVLISEEDPTKIYAVFKKIMLKNREEKESNRKNQNEEMEQKDLINIDSPENITFDTIDNANLTSIFTPKSSVTAQDSNGILRSKLKFSQKQQQTVTSQETNTNTDTFTDLLKNCKALNLQYDQQKSAGAGRKIDRQNFDLERGPSKDSMHEKRTRLETWAETSTLRIETTKLESSHKIGQLRFYDPASKESLFYSNKDAFIRSTSNNLTEKLKDQDPVINYSPHGKELYDQTISETHS